jgi:hypothetical protein
MVSSIDLESSEEWMIYWSLIHILTFFLDFFSVIGAMNRDKDLEIIVLRQQVRILQRKVKSPRRITDPERMILAIPTNRYKQSADDARQRLPKPLDLLHGVIVHRPDPHHAIAFLQP